MRQGKQATALQQDDEALSCAIALQTGLLAVGVGCVNDWGGGSARSKSALVLIRITSTT